MRFEVAADPVCKIEGCGKSAKAHGAARGWCRSHYDRWRSHGDPLAGGTVRGACKSFIDYAALAFSGDDCLEWPFGRHPDGYGNTYYPGFRTRQVHRIVCTLAHGEPPAPDLQAAHSCGNTSCCNPGHLRWATRTENAADKVKHGTQTRGESHAVTRLTETEVLEIRRRAEAGESYKAIAASFGVAESYVGAIKRRANWRHV